METLEKYSVYNILHNIQTTTPQAADHPLRDLLPEKPDRGWHSARSHRKSLNHLGHLRGKERLARRLNLHNQWTTSGVFGANYRLLEEHQAGRISTQRIIHHLARQLGLPAITVASWLREYATIRHLEFHPTDVCNLSCNGCTYGHDDPRFKPPPVNFTFERIQRIAPLRPRSMVIIGGGEPTLYRYKQQRFQQMVDELVRTNPEIQLALVTNGTHKPPGIWPNKFEWIRVSLDAASESMYTAFRGKPMFRRVMANYLEYLDNDVPEVGISFLFARSNVHQYATVAKFVFDLVREAKPQSLPKVNIQYRPLRRDPYRYDKPFTEAVTAKQVQETVREVRELADSSWEIKDFLKNQTNITAILGGSSHPAYEFSRCYYSQVFRIIRANGDLRPCFIRVQEPDFVLGNITTDSLEKIALNTLYVGARRKPHCDPQGCRQCHVNYTFEQGLLGKLHPSDSPDVREDPMF